MMRSFFQVRVRRSWWCSFFPFFSRGLSSALNRRPNLLNDAALPLPRRKLFWNRSRYVLKRNGRREVKTLTQGILATQVGLQTEIHGLSRGD